MAVRAVVFDLDGTLIQSMENHWKSYVQIFHKHLAGLTEPTFLQVCNLEGQRAAEVITILAREQGREVPAATARELGEEKQRLFRHMGHPPAYPGAHELLADLKRRGIRVGLATGTNRQNTEHMLGPAVSSFEVIVTGEDVKRAKPDPEPYVKAFAALGVPPAEGVVVENAPLGIDAGRAAGARVVAVSHTLPPARLAHADVVVPDLRAADKAILGWIG